MSVFVPVTNAAQFTMQYAQSDGSFAENEFWVQRSAAWTQAELLTMAAALKTWFSTGDGTHSAHASMNSRFSLSGVGYRDMTTQNGFTGVYQTGLPIAGGNVQTPAPLGITFSLTARTGLAGRSFRGRTFIVGLSVTNFLDEGANTIDPAFASTWQAIYNSLITAVPAADATCTLVVCSRYHQVGGAGSGSVPRAAGVTTPITGYGWHDLYSDFQRRRAPGHNRHH